MVETQLNENDKKLLALCQDLPKSITDIAKALNIAPKNVSVRINKLKKLGIINILKEGKGKKTLIRTKEGNKTKEFMLKLLKEINKKGGEVTREEFSLLLPSDYSSMENMIKSGEYDKITARWNLLREGWINEKLFITEKGKQLLKDK